jgi:hypothetical protein
MTWLCSIRVDHRDRPHGGVTVSETGAGIPGLVACDEDEGVELLRGKEQRGVPTKAPESRPSSCFDPAAAQQIMNTWSANQSCTTDGFVAAAFGPGATYIFGTYKYVYTSRNSSLCESKWVDQTSGDTGDIATSCS